MSGNFRVVVACRATAVIIEFGLLTNSLCIVLLCADVALIVNQSFKSKLAAIMLDIS